MKNSSDLNNLIRIEISNKKMIAIIGSSLIFFIASLVLWKLNTIDNNIVIHFNYVYENEMHLNLVKMLSHYGMSLITLVYALVLALSFRIEDLEDERPVFILVLISFAFGGIGGDILKEIIDKARPIITLSGQIAITNLNDTPAFPSGHATKSMALALPFLIFASHKNIITAVTKILVLAAALLVCFSRVALQAHFLSDVIAGIGTALVFIPLSLLFVNFLISKKNISIDKLPLMSKRFILVFAGLTIILSMI